MGSVGKSSINQSVTACVPALGGGLPCPGVSSVSGSSMNRAVTGCVPALGGGLSCPGISRIGVSIFMVLYYVLSIRRWSAVAFPFCPPACASDMFTTLYIILFIIRSNSFPMLLPRVIPRSLLHFPFFPFPL